jgi:hypothetical protein
MHGTRIITVEAISQQEEERSTEPEKERKRDERQYEHHGSLMNCYSERTSIL